jgi:hypothetical protein
MKASERNTVRNLRYRFPKETEKYRDEELLRIYHQFSVSEDYGDNDSRFPTWL